MARAIAEVESALETFDKPEIWSDDVKATDGVMEPIFKSFSNLIVKNLLEG